jgi:hypothetical protein
MGKDKRLDDTISENEYTMRMKSVSSKPQDDSPGDSESDAGTEFEMGLEYLPKDEEESANSSAEIPKHPPKKIPESAKVIASEQPAPWMDRSKPSSTN